MTDTSWHNMRQFTLEVRLYPRNKQSYASMKYLMRKWGREAHGALALIGEPCKNSGVVLYSDDFFEGHEDLNMSEPIGGYDG
jgi:hypothetical protein